MTEPDSAPFDPRRHGWQLDDAEGFIGTLAAIWQREHEGRLEFGLLAGPQHANRNKTVHGGLLMTFVDRAFGATTRRLTGARRGSTVSQSHQFMTPLQLGQFASLTPRLLQDTKRMGFIEGTVIAEGRTILHSQGVWRIDRSPAE